MTKASDNEYPSVLLDEQASAPTTPATGFWRVYAKSDGLYIVDDAGSETGPFGGGGSSDLSGEELDHVQITSNVAITGTAEGSETTVLTGTSQAYEAVPTLIEVFTTRFDATESLVVVLYDGATLLGRLAITDSTLAPMYLAHRLTPTAATHQYIVKAYKGGAGAVNWLAGAGGTGTSLPSFLRVTRV